MADTLLPFFFEALPVRGAIVRLERSLATLITGRGYPAFVERLLGESAAAASLIASTLKNPGRLTVQLSSDGPLRVLATQCRDSLDLRGMALLGDTQALHGTEPAFGELLAGGRCSVTIGSDNVRERYQGIVEVHGDSMAASLDNFFATSIQVPTRFWLFADGAQALGIMLQVVAGHDTFAGSDDWHRLGLVTDTLASGEALATDPTTVLRRIFAEDDIRLAEGRDVRFHCDCSRERAARAVEMLGEADASQAVAEQGELVVTCEYCGIERRFNPVDVAQIFVTTPVSPAKH